jgi:hypothetical protein
VVKISFWAIITTDADEPLMILEAYPEGTELELSNYSQGEPGQLTSTYTSCNALQLNSSGRRIEAPFPHRAQLES